MRKWRPREGEGLAQGRPASEDGLRCHLQEPTAELCRANTAGEGFFRKPGDLSSLGRCDSQDTNIFNTYQNKAARVTSLACGGRWKQRAIKINCSLSGDLLQQVGPREGVTRKAGGNGDILWD